jgi:hypothetical protein
LQHPKYKGGTPVTTSPINPDLNAIPTGLCYEITHNPTTKHETLLDAPDGRLLTTLPKHKFLQLRSKYNPPILTTLLSETLATLAIKHSIANISYTPNTDSKLYKSKPHKPQMEMNGTLPIPATLYGALHSYFIIQRFMYCNPITLPLKSTTYISHETLDQKSKKRDPQDPRLRVFFEKFGVLKTNNGDVANF